MSEPTIEFDDGNERRTFCLLDDYALDRVREQVGPLESLLPIDPRIAPLADTLLSEQSVDGVLTYGWARPDLKTVWATTLILTSIVEIERTRYAR